MPHVLYSQGGVLVLGVDPDDTMAQAAHGENSTSGEGCARDSRSAQESLIRHEHFQPDSHIDAFHCSFSFYICRICHGRDKIIR